MKKKFQFFILLSIEVILIFIIMFAYAFISSKIKNKSSFENSILSFYEKNKTTDFSVQKIISYSSAYGKNKNTNFEKDNWILDIYQYTDFAIFLSQNNPENFVKKLWLDSFKITTPPSFGAPSVFYQDALKLGTESLQTDYPFNDASLEFTVLNDINSENTIKYNTPVFFADCSSPITLKYVNMIANNYTLANTKPLNLNGSILENFFLESTVISCSFEFTIHILNQKNEESFCNILLSIPLTNNKENLISAGSITKIQDSLFIPFIK